MLKSKKHLLIIDSILLLGVLVTVFLLVGYTQPLAIAPLSSESESLLFTLPEVDYVLIDDTSKFDSPDTVFLNDKINLKSGRYFIKFFNGLQSEIREITFELDVILQFKTLEDGTIGFFNLGDSALQVDVYDTGSLVDSSVAYAGGENE